MLLLLAIGFVAGIVTALSPCVLPVLPIVLAGGATGRRPLAIIAGIVASFTVFTLSRRGCSTGSACRRTCSATSRSRFSSSSRSPCSCRRWPSGWRPLPALTRRRPGDRGGGFLLGVSLGLVFVPCAGPVLAAVTVVAARREVGLELPADALVCGRSGRADARDRVRGRARRPHLRRQRDRGSPRLGVLVAGAAVAIALGADRELQTALPGYTESLQERFERSDAASASCAI